jgi:hypothetical protein
MAWFAEIVSQLSEAKLRELTVSLNQVSRTLSSTITDGERES